MFFPTLSFMKWHVTKEIGFGLCFTLLLLFASVLPLFAQSETDATGKERRSDTVQVRRKKLGQKKTWEKAVSFPGTLVYLPLKLTFKLVKESIIFVDESKVISKTHDDGRRGVLPTYADRTGGGIKAFQKGWLSPESKLTLSLTAGPRERQRYQLQFKRVSLFGDTLSSDFTVGYQFLSDESFFGIGPDSRESDESNFAHEQATAEASFGTKLGKSKTHGLSERLSLDAIIGYDLNDISEGKDKSLPFTTNLFNRKSLPGLEEQVSIGRLQIGLKYDSKNRSGNPSKGSEASLAVGVFEELDRESDYETSEFGFWKFKADLRQYIHLFYDRSLSFRLAGEVTEPFSDREIPFYYLGELGRGETIRGFSRGRFRDRDMVLASLEYRYPIRRRLDAMLFVDVGQVAFDIFSDLSTDDFEVGYGGGIRIWGAEGLVSMFVIGKSRDEFRIYFGLN